MATIDVDHVYALQAAGSGQPDVITVIGSAPGCTQLLVALSWHAPDASPHNLSQSVTVQGGGWAASFHAPADFDPAWVACNGPVHVTVTSTSPPLQIDKDALHFQCADAPACPTFQKLEYLGTDGSCDLDNARQIRVRATIDVRAEATSGIVSARSEVTGHEYSGTIAWPANEPSAIAYLGYRNKMMKSQSDWRGLILDLKKLLEDAGPPYNVAEANAVRPDPDRLKQLVRRSGIQ